MESGFSLSDIDKWDMEFYFDILMRKEEKESKEAIKNADSGGF